MLLSWNDYIAVLQVQEEKELAALRSAKQRALAQRDVQLQQLEALKQRILDEQAADKAEGALIRQRALEEAEQLKQKVRHAAEMHEPSYASGDFCNGAVLWPGGSERWRSRLFAPRWNHLSIGLHTLTCLQKASGQGHLGPAKGWRGCGAPSPLLVKMLPGLRRCSRGPAMPQV